MGEARLYSLYLFANNVLGEMEGKRWLGGSHRYLSNGVILRTFILEWMIAILILG